MDESISTKGLSGLRSWPSLGSAKNGLDVVGHFQRAVPRDAEEPNNNAAGLNKKRKLQVGQLGLPIRKHKCSDRTFSSEPEVDSLHIHIIKQEQSEFEPAKDNNGSTGDSDYVMSICGKSKLQYEYPITSLSDRPSTSSTSWGSNSFTDYRCSAVSMSATKIVADEVGRTTVTLEEQLLEFGNLIDYVEHVSTVYENDSMEDSNVMKPNIYVLSSGRWSVAPEPQPGIRSPTIDQEFEEYFSSLMLE